MPRNPARRFLADLARSRNVAKLLSPVTQAGLTIIQVGENGTYGRFVPKGTPDGIDVKDGLHISSKEIPDAAIIRSRVAGPLTSRDLLRLVTRRRVAKRLFGDSTRIQLEGARDLLGEFEPDNLRFRAVQNERCISKGALFVVQGRNLPPLAQLSTHFTRTGLNALIVLAPLTQRHFAAFHVTARENGLRVRRKSVFHVVVEEGAKADAAVVPPVGGVTHVKRGLGA
jgi:hypothetical protein